MRESSIEKAVTKFAEKFGWLARKVTSPGSNGMPDHEYFKDGHAIQIEFKKEGEDPDPQQKMQIKFLKQHGMEVHVIDNTVEGKKVFSGRR